VGTPEENGDEAPEENGGDAPKGTGDEALEGTGDPIADDTATDPGGRGMPQLVQCKAPGGNALWQRTHGDTVRKNSLSPSARHTDWLFP
jgi:hypothetical protein